MFSYPRDKDIVFVDIEANQKPKRLIQFGAIKLKLDKTTEEFNIFSNPKCKLSDHIKEMLKNNLENIKNAQDNIKSLRKIYKILNNTVFMSFGNFDYQFLESLSEKLLNKKLNVTFIDMQEEFKKVSMQKNPTSLKNLANFFGVSFDDNQQHDGLYDARILYEIFVKWNSTSNEELEEMLFNHRANFETQVKLSQNRTKESLTINNLNKFTGYTIVNIEFQEPCKMIYEQYHTKFLSKLNVIEVQNNIIKRNWTFQYDVTNKRLDIDDYEEELVRYLKQFIISTRDKKIIIKDSNYHSLIRLCNLCSRYINVFPLNKIIYSTGFSELYHKINYDHYKYQQNLNLIKDWLVFQHLKEN